MNENIQPKNNIFKTALQRFNSADRIKWLWVVVGILLFSAFVTEMIPSNSKSQKAQEFVNGPAIGSVDNPNNRGDTSTQNESKAKPAETSSTTTAKINNKTNQSPTTSSSSGSGGSTSESSNNSQPPNSSSVPISEDNTPAPTLYLPYSTSSNAASTMTPMGETIYHPKPQNPYGHPGIDFQWENPSEVPNIISSMDGTVVAINDNSSHSGTYDVITTNGKWGVDYAELGSVKSGLKVGDTIKVGDEIGTPQHPSSITDQPNFRMIHWQFGYSNNSSGVGTRLCPLSYFSTSAKTSIESLWASVNAPELKANAPDICSGDYAD